MKSSNNLRTSSSTFNRLLALTPSWAPTFAGGRSSIDDAMCEGRKLVTDREHSFIYRMIRCRVFESILFLMFRYIEHDTRNLMAHVCYAVPEEAAKRGYSIARCKDLSKWITERVHGDYEMRTVFNPTTGRTYATRPGDGNDESWTLGPGVSTTCAAIHRATTDKKQASIKEYVVLIRREQTNRSTSATLSLLRFLFLSVFTSLFLSLRTPRARSGQRRRRRYPLP
jgi:hypothetical protein